MIYSLYEKHKGFVKVNYSGEAVQSANGKKVYSADHAFADAISGLSSCNTGQKLENIVFLHLKRQTDRIYYYKTKSGFEVDFAVGRDDDIRLIQVLADITTPDTREREKRSLSEAMKELNLTESTIVTISDEEDIVSDHGIIHVVPAWRYLLEAQ